MFEIKDIQIDTIHPLQKSFSIRVTQYICDDDGKVVAIKMDNDGNNMIHREAFTPGQFDRVTVYLESQGLTDEAQKQSVMDCVAALWTPEIVQAYRDWEQEQALAEEAERQAALQAEVERSALIAAQEAEASEIANINNDE